MNINDWVLDPINQINLNYSVSRLEPSKQNHCYSINDYILSPFGSKKNKIISEFSYDPHYNVKTITVPNLMRL